MTPRPGSRLAFHPTTLRNEKMTYFRNSIVRFGLLCCGLVPGQEPDSVAKGDYGDGGGGVVTPGTGHDTTL